MMRDIQPVTCPFCSLLCNDLHLSFEKGVLTGFSPACSRGEAGFRLAAAGSTFEEPAYSAIETSFQKARTWLREAHQPLVVLSGNLDVEGVSAAIRLAKHFSAMLACDEDCSGSALTLSMQTTGLLTDTLRDLHTQSLVVLCGVDPARTHPRLGEFLRRDLIKKTLVLDPADPLEAIRWLRVAIMNPADRLPPGLAKAAKRIAAARSGLVVFSLEWLKAGGPFTTELLLWLKDLNKEKRWNALYLAPSPNTIGVIETLLSDTGFPGNLRFGLEETDFSARSWQAEGIIQKGGTDLCILVGQPGYFSEKTLTLLSERRTILFDPEMPAWDPPIWIPCAQAGVEGTGLFQRLDGVPVELQAVFPSQRRLMKDLLFELANEDEPL